MAPVCSTSVQKKSRRQIKTPTSFFLKYLHQPPITTSIFKITVLAEPTSVELHKGRDQLSDRQRMVLHHFRESLSTRLDSRVGDKQHFHQLGNKIGVPDVVLAADEHHQEGDNILHTWLIQNLGRIPIIIIQKVRSIRDEYRTSN